MGLEFSGVTWLHGFEQNATLRTAILDLVAEAPQDNAVYVSAEKAAAHVPAIRNKLFKGFNTIATLLAAIGILEQANRLGRVRQRSHPGDSVSTARFYDEVSIEGRATPYKGAGGRDALVPQLVWTGAPQLGHR